MEETKKYEEEEEKSARRTKKLKRAQIRTPTKPKTVMCPSKKTLTKQLTILKKKKDRIHQEEYQRSRGLHDENEDTLLGRDTQKDEVENDKKDCTPPERTMDK